MTAAPLAPDVHSFARPAEARVTHVALDLQADFTAHRLGGRATLTFVRRPDVRELVLDTRGLEIRQVLDERQQPLTFRLEPPVEHLGQALVIALPASGDRVVVEYRTSPDAAALQWLTPAQTAGRIHPYLYSQGEAILTRTWIPTQDSPAIRQTYEASITVPRPLAVVMSAEMTTPKGTDAGNGLRTYKFKMDQPVPPYLIAIAAGDIAFRSLGPRTGVYTEPTMIERSARELEDLEKMIAAAETLGGPYRWGRYDVLVLPPSFPFGGMENPRLTFATPTILAGDKSLVSLLAHELAHSWSGNLVTNATWGDFWLNEGFTTYFENRIMEALYGKDRALMLASLGRNELMREMADLPPADTKLSLDLKGRDPDIGMNSVAYEKGAALVRTIEQAVGRDRFDPWLRGYFNRHAFTSITTQEFVADLQQELIRGDTSLRDALNLPAWLDQPGLPANAAPVQSPAFAQVEGEAQRFAQGATASSLAVAGMDAAAVAAPARTAAHGGPHTGTVARSRRHVRPQRVGQQRDPVCLAQGGRGAPVRAGRACARALPHRAGTPQVPAPAVRRPHADPVGPAHRPPRLRRRAQFLPRRVDADDRHHREVTRSAFGIRPSAFEVALSRSAFGVRRSAFVSCVQLVGVRPGRSMKIATWNVNGIRARGGQVEQWLDAERPDVMCLQEIKASREQVPMTLAARDDYWTCWHGSGGYSGVALLVHRDLAGAECVAVAPGLRLRVPRRQRDARRSRGPERVRAEWRQGPGREDAVPRGARQPRRRGAS